MPGQAAILCGGLGTRLRPLTDRVPKPMVPVNGKPFLERLVLQLKEQGIQRVVLLTGYLGEQIVRHFGSGERLGVEIVYSSGPPEWDTGCRLWQARELLDEQFLLLYSDNFVQFNYRRLCRLHEQHRLPITLLLAPKLKGNIRVAPDGRIESYDKERNGEGFNYVEVGYMLIERDQVLADLSSIAGFPDVNFSVLLHLYAAQSKIAGLVVRDPYHSISDPERLALMNEYLKPKRILLIDRDGTINRKATAGEYITSWDDFEWISDNRQAMCELSQDGFSFIIITNQAGIARNMLTYEELETIHENMVRDLAADGIEILKIYVSPHHWDENSFMRKPAPGMFFQAAQEFCLRMDRCLYIGDDVRDCQAAGNAGCGMVYLTEEDDIPELSELPHPILAGRTLNEAVPFIRQVYRLWEETE